MRNQAVSVRIRGELACFTRPEAKVERVSYPVMTPCAARGILEAIYWHPQFLWRVLEIRVLSEVKTFSILRNEVNSKMSLSSEGIFASQDRTQRHAVCLRDADYLVTAAPIAKRGTEPAEKHRDIFNRRVERGQCYHRPALGTREFAADFGPADGAPEPIEWSEDLGIMLWVFEYPGGTHDDRGWHPTSKPPFRPMFFHAEIHRGVLAIPGEPIGGRR